MKTLILELPNGRLGNSIFRYFAYILLKNKTDAVRTFRHINEYPSIIIKDDTFLDFYNIATKDMNLKLILLEGYFQFDFLCQHRAEIIQHFENHPNDILWGTDLHCHLIQNTVRELTQTPDNLRHYDLVVHLRLEDFINSNNMIHPGRVVEQIVSALQTLPTETRAAAIVCNKPTAELEHIYIQYIIKNSPISFVIETNDIITDFHIIKNAHTVICTYSTFAWGAVFLSKTIQKVYCPIRKDLDFKCSFQENMEVVLYDNAFCGPNAIRELGAAAWV
jgi:hypothetical protein